MNLIISLISVLIIATLEDPDTMLHGRLGYGKGMGMETVGAA